MAANPYISFFGNVTPVIDAEAYIDISARIIGDVRIAPGSSIWPGAVLRADDDEIVIGKDSAVLDLCLIEAPKGSPVHIANDVIISHKACIHGAEVKTGALVGIGAIVLDNAVIGENALVGAGALIPPNTVVPDNMLMLGQPAKPVREINQGDRRKIEAQLNELKTKAAVYRKY
ncbi:gamma carbonic anhydrase family protein [uncultured Desulfosarcina sp.]|uniref:gamma carbonic anhydrase family protein n=1 Tax=uncultured Desulfosarcina sp. TaxID=218289 RepID=UPI0029C78A98|nr:gamma carbonic anhydrase family protein [uncultured Desulfosarcina sp.]